jgi:hypothetical protein
LGRGVEGEGGERRRPQHHLDMEEPEAVVGEVLHLVAHDGLEVHVGDLLRARDHGC